MELLQTEVGINFKPKKWKEEEVNAFLDRMGKKYESKEDNFDSMDEDDDDFEFLENDEDDKMIAEILETKKISVNLNTLRKYKGFLKENLEKPTLLTGIEDFRWEEKYIFGYGEKGEYERMKKINPSYTDEFLLLKILPADTFERDLIVEVRRVSDKKKFMLPLSELEAVDTDSVNYGILNLFSIWVVNYLVKGK